MNEPCFSFTLSEGGFLPILQVFFEMPDLNIPLPSAAVLAGFGTPCCQFSYALIIAFPSGLNIPLSAISIYANTLLIGINATLVGYSATFGIDATFQLPTCNF